MRLALQALLIAGLLCVFAPRAEAYPQFQFSTGNTRCTLCHFSPTGGGLITEWGRDEAADTISRGGDGRFLYGLWDTPEWLELGADYRGAFGVRDTEAAEIDLLGFPMQADVYSRMEFGDFKINTTIGLRGSPRARNPPVTSRVYARELYAMWQPKITGAYARVGRFFAPYGLRQPDHTSYIRRDLGYYAWEETLGASGGYLKDDWELHVSAFTRDPIVQVGFQGHGAAIMYEKRFADDKAAWGAQGKVQLAPDSTQYWGGGTLKYWFGSLDLLLLTELDLGVRDVDVPGSDAILHGIAHVNLTHFITQGLMVGTTLEAKHGDLNLRGKDSEAATLNLQYFPRAHWEVHLLGRYERTRNTRDLLSLLMLHYYL